MDTPTAFPALQGAEFMVLTTHRRTGEPVPTTVWFAQAGDRLYVMTMGVAGKARRIRATPDVLVAPSDAMGNVYGPSEPAQARVLDPSEFPAAINVLRAKYNPRFDEVVGRPGDPALTMGGRIYIEVRPAERAIA